MNHPHPDDSPAASPQPADTPDRFRARFVPQAWINDYAVNVDPEGPVAWDCTREVTGHLAYFNRLQAGGFDGNWDDDGGLLDNDDWLKSDPDAPAWVRDWSGPFSIYVTRNPVAG